MIKSIANRLSTFELCHGLCHTSQGISQKADVKGSSTNETPVEASMILEIHSIVVCIINGAGWERYPKTDSHFSLKKKPVKLCKREYMQLDPKKTHYEICSI